MTTKLTEAEVKALPVCKLCGRKPGPSPYWLTCNFESKECDLEGTYAPETWRLLMTPEAKGEKDISIHDAVERLNKAITSVKHDWVHASAERDSLQSKLAKSEKELKDYQDSYTLRAGHMEDLKQQIASLKQQLAEESTRSITRLEESYRLQNILNEVTKPVGDEELEKAITSITDWISNKRMELGEDTDILIRAARQRKPSGDAVKLAEAVNDYLAGIPHTSAVIKSIANSIIAQAAAGETKPLSDPNVGAATDYGYVQELEKLKAARVPAADFNEATPEPRKFVLHADAHEAAMKGELCTCEHDKSLHSPACSVPMCNCAEFVDCRSVWPADPILITATPEALAKIDAAKKNPAVTLSGFELSFGTLGGVRDALDKILKQEFMLVFRDGDLFDRREGLPPYSGDWKFPAADLLTEMERKDLEFARTKDFRQIITWEKAVDYLICMIDRLAPAPSAATPAQHPLPPEMQ